MFTPVCLPQSSACCLKNGSAVGMKWFHCRSETVAPEMLAGAAVLVAGVGWGAAAGWVGWPTAGGVVGFAAAAGAEVGAAAAGAVVAGAAAGAVAAGLQAAASKTTPLLSACLRNSRRLFMRRSP